MSKQVSTKATEKELSRSAKIFGQDPIWKALLKMAGPSMILMFVLGSYFFFDSVLSINFANDSYHDIKTPSGYVLESNDQVRLFMNGYSPINSLMIAISILFGMGIGTRVAINLGAKRKERALNTIRVGFMYGMATSIIAVPILVFAAKPWIASQYDASIATMVSDEAFKYAWPVIISFPLIVFNQIMSSLFRTEARNKQMMIALVTPIFINLFLDWVFMGPLGMGVEGGAWATFISNAFTTVLFIIFVFTNKKTMITFRNLFGFKMKSLSIIGILLVGLSPFLRNVVLSMTSTVQMSVIKDVSKAVYNNPNFMTLVLTGAMPVFTLFFPIMFAFAQAARPIAGYNYGAGNYKRVRQTYWFTLLYATTAAIIIYFLVAWGLSNPLMSLLQVSDPAFGKAEEAIKIFMLALVGFGPAIAGMVLFGSTDKIVLSILASSMRGIILFFPIIFIMRALAIDNPASEYLFWWLWPIINTIASLVLTTISMVSLHRMGKANVKRITLDERIQKINDRFSKKEKDVKPTRVKK